MLLGIAALLFTLVMLFVPKIRQPQSYHDFADKRTLIAGIPNTLDVLSNVAFLIAAIVAVALIQRASIAATTFVIGTFATCAGSTFYHLHPNDARLVYDRLGMIICFAALVALLIDKGRSTSVLLSLLALGVASVVWWRITDDLRPYGFVQFFPMILLLIKRDRLLIGAAICYALAKACETFDKQIFAALHVVSGHTLKHLVAAVATMIIAMWIARGSPRPWQQEEK
jgi:hypothetical protein